MRKFRGPVQAEAAECGLSCVAICLNLLGADVDMASLRQRFPASARGLTIKHISDVCSQLDLTTRAIRCDIDAIRALKSPAILHWKMNHFVVLLRTSRNGQTVIVDPAVGEVTVDAAELSRSFTGVALEVSRAPGFVKRRERSALSIWGMISLRGELAAVLLKAGLLSLFLQAYTLGSPFFLQLAVDEAALKADLGLLQTLAIGFALFALLNAVAEALRGMTLQYATSILSWDMSTRMFHHMLRLPLSWFQRRKLADVLSRFESLDPIKNLVANGFVAAVFDGALGLSLLVAMFVYSGVLAWIALAGVALVVALKFATVQYSMQLGMGALQAGIAEKGKRIETLRAIQTIKVLGGEAAREVDWANRLGTSIVATQRSAKLQVYLKVANSFVESIGLVAVTYFGARHVISNELSVGMLYAFLSYRQQFSSRALSLVDQLISWRLLDMHSGRLADIALSQREHGIDLPMPHETQLDGAVELRGISYRYSDQEPFILKNISLSIEKGEFVAIVGPSGMGKSTLLKILTGLYAPTGGEVLFDGISASTLGPRYVRSNIGVVLQDDELFSGSIIDNVSFFAENPDLEHVMRCLEMAAVLDDIRAMPMQLHTLVGDMGSSLSGGQKQRLLLARALYRKPNILILDEATSNLDVRREKAIHATLKEFSMTRIVVTHRPETAKLADRIFHLESGGLRAMMGPVAEPPRNLEAEHSARAVSL